MTNAVAMANKRGGRPKTEEPKRKKLKSELVRPILSVMNPTDSWSREQMAAMLNLSLAGYDRAYKERPDQMPPRFRSGHQYHHPAFSFLEWQQQQLVQAKAETEAARRKSLASKARKRTEPEASATANEA
jgi:hypothetical protein